MPLSNNELYHSISLSDILQKHSINSLLDRHDLLNAGTEPAVSMMSGETMSISELLGLNSPRGLLNFGNGNPSTPSGLCTPPVSGNNYQLNFDDPKFQSNPLNYATVASPIKPLLQRNISINSTGTPPSTPSYNANYGRAFRSTSFSDSCCSSSPSVLESSLLSGSNSRSNSPESDTSCISNNNNSLNQENYLTDLLNTLTLNESLARNLLAGNTPTETELGLHGLPLHALKYLQQQHQQQQQQQQNASVLNSLFPAICSHGAPQLLDKWNANALMNLMPENLHLDRAARFHRTAASVFDATCTWSGVLPERTAKPVGYSSKVFLGGVPWDISEQTLVQTFKQFGAIRVEWPGKDKQATQPKGYVYIIFESEKNVRALLSACAHDFSSTGNWYYKISSKRMKAKEVQVIPWVLNDSNYTRSTSQKLDPTKTVFVGALHGMLNAEGLAKIMNDLFDGVVYAGIDTDKHKYPIGSGRVTFNNPRSYMKAVAAAFIEIKTSKFTKKVQVDPYLEDSLCHTCGVQQGPYFCRDMNCFHYFCRTCWQWRHVGELAHHKPLMRNSKHTVAAAAVAASAGLSQTAAAAGLN